MADQGAKAYRDGVAFAEGTLRDQFAMAALPAIISVNYSENIDDHEMAAEDAYEYADAMLAARTQEPEG